MILQYWLAAPSVSPTPSNLTPGTFLVRHRRVNPDGTYTAPSPATDPIILPNTLTPQTYATPSDVARDEFLISNDSGVTWRIVPRTTTLTGAQTISAFDSTWTITSLTDTQTIDYTAVDFGEFLSGDSDVKTVWVLNQTGTFNSLRFEVLDDFDKPTDALSGILEIAITGIANAVGNGTLNTSFNDTKVVDRSIFGSNWFPLTSVNPSAIRVELQLVNYPLSGIDQNIDYQLSVVPNGSPSPINANPVRAGRIIDSIDDSGIVDGSNLLNDGDGIYVYLTTDSVLTIGNQASGADLSEAWLDKLFNLVWRIYPSNPIYDSTGGLVSRGTSAIADWNANRRLELPHLLDRVLAGRSTTNAVGTVRGAATYSLTVANLPAHDHTLTTDGTHTHAESTEGTHLHAISITSGAESVGHTHSFSATTGTQSASHTHSAAGGIFVQASPPGSGVFTLNSSAGTAHQIVANTSTQSTSHTHSVSGTTGGVSASHTHLVSGDTATAGSHTHTIDSAGSHTHTVGSTGSGTSFDLYQPTHFTHKLISTGY